MKLITRDYPISITVEYTSLVHVKSGEVVNVNGTIQKAETDMLVWADRAKVHFSDIFETNVLFTSNIRDYINLDDSRNTIDYISNIQAEWYMYSKQQRETILDTLRQHDELKKKYVAGSIIPLHKSDEVAVPDFKTKGCRWFLLNQKDLHYIERILEDDNQIVRW